MKLNDKFEREGRYETPVSLFLQKMMIVLAFATASFCNMYWYQEMQTRSDTMITMMMKMIHFTLGAMFLAGTLQQSGFFVHDAMHNHIFHKRHIDQQCGFYVGSIIFGLSSKGWRNKHNDHHLYTNSHVKDVGPSDPQMFEDVWIQHADLIPYFPSSLIPYILRFQKYYFIPLCIFVSPIAMRIVSLARNRRVDEFFGMMLHFTCLGRIIQSFDTKIEGILFVYLS